MRLKFSPAKLRQIRNDHDPFLSQDALSALSLVSKTTISNLETGKSEKPSAELLSAIVRALGKTVEDVMEEVADEEEILA